MIISRIGVAVIGGGPAGISAAIAASVDGASVVLIEREKRLGGKLNQSIHAAYGFMRFDDALAGPEYAFMDISTLNQTNTIVMLQTSVTDIVRIGNGFQLTISNRHGVSIIESNSIILATGCRERTTREAGIHGSRPSGLFTAGTAQYLLNVMGQLPVTKCIILGSNNLALFTARDLAISGASVIGVYEPSDASAGGADYVSECLFDFDIPFHPRHTVTRVLGSERVRAAELARTDGSGLPIRGSENVVLCDGLISANGFTPQNELAVSLGAVISEITQGPVCDQNRMTTVDGVFACGNALHIFGSAELISESGEIAGRCAARHISHSRQIVEITTGKDILTCVPQHIDCEMLREETVICFTVSAMYSDANVRLLVNSTEVFTQNYAVLQPNLTYSFAVRFADGLAPDSVITLRVD